MGGAQPLAAVMAGASCLRSNASRRASKCGLRTRYLDRQTQTSTRRWAIIEQAGRDRKPVSVGLLGNAADIFPSWYGAACGPMPSPTRPRRTIPSTVICRRDGRPPNGKARRETDPRGVQGPRGNRWQSMSAPCSTSPHGNSGRRLRQQHSARWHSKRASRTHSISRASCRPTSGRCSAAASAHSAGRRCPGDPEDIYRTDAKVKELLPDNKALHHWLDMARERIAFQGLPARICWVGLGDRHRLGLAFNEMVARGELKAPVVIGRDHLDSGSSPRPTARPNR